MPKRHDMKLPAAELPCSEGEPSPGVIAAAASWYVRLQDQEATDEERRECDQWRLADPMHQRAWQRLDALWRNFDDLEGAATDPAQATLEKLSTRKCTKRRVKRTIGTTITCVGVLVLVSEWMHPHLLVDHYTGVARREAVTLPDGSQLTLDARSAVDIRYSSTERRVILREGQILAQVNQDPAHRPFIVQTKEGTATALGTRYTVSVHRQGMVVNVIESSVRACAADDGAQACTDLEPGQSATVSNGNVARMYGSGYTDPAAWTQGYLALDNQPLSRVLHDLKAYHSGFLLYDDKSLESIRVSGVIPLDNSTQALNTLAATLPIRIHGYEPLVLTIKKTE